MDIERHRVCNVEFDFDVTFPFAKLAYGIDNMTKAWGLSTIDEGKEFLNNSFKELCYLINEDDIVIDCGAHYGFMTAIMAKLVGDKGFVTSVEPVLVSYNQLVTNIKLNEFDNVKALNLALGDKIDTVPMFGAKIVTSGGDAVVNMVTLDSLNLQPNFIKIDVEASEVKVIRGALETISKYSPRMQIELHFFKTLHVTDLGDTPKMLLEMLFDNDYVVVYRHSILGSVDFFKPNEDYGGQIYAIPLEYWDECGNWDIL